MRGGRIVWVPMLTLQDVRDAAGRIAGRVHHTPLLSSTQLGRRVDAKLWLKAESLQKTGSFKARGVLNRLAVLTPEERARGVVTVSAGNHAQALAWGAAAAGVHATVVMFSKAPATKVAASRGYGAEVVLHGASNAEAFQRARELERERGLVFVHPFDDVYVAAGAGTVGLEILDDLPDADVLVVPIGGGGLIAGIASAVKALRPSIRVYGVEPEGSAVMRKSLDAGRPLHLDKVETIADGLGAPMTEQLPFDVVRQLVDDVVLVTDDEIRMAMRELALYAKLVAEPAGAAATAAILTGRVPISAGARVVSVVSGGNVDPALLADALRGAPSRE